MATYTYESKEVLVERMWCWKVRILKDSELVKETTLMSEGGCAKWANEEIMRLQRKDAKSPIHGTSWIEETFGKKGGSGV